MNIAPLVSVIMPSYNSKKYIKKAIDSVLEQTYSNFELIIVDGNSTDGTLDILDEYKKQDRRIKVIQDEGRGIGAALQLGCQIASGKFIARMDSDDIAINTRFEKQLKIFHSIPNLILVASPVIYINEDDSIVGYSFPYTNKRIIQEKVYLIAHPTVMMKKDAYVKAGGYQPLLRAEDYFLWNRMRLMGEFYIFKEPLIKYRLLQDSLSHTLDDNFNKKLGRKLESYFIKPIISEIDIIEIKYIRYIIYIS